MKRSDIVKKLVFEGFSEKTLSNFTDKQIFELSSRILGEAPLKGSVVMNKMTAKPDDVKKLTDSGVNVELREKEVKEKPSAGLTKKKKSEVVKRAKKGGDIGKKGKGFKKIEKKAKESGADDPKAVSAAAMWKNLKRENTEVKEWVKNLVENKYHSFTTKNEIMELISEKMEMSDTPKFFTYDSIVKAANPQTSPEEDPVETPVIDPDVDPGEPFDDPSDPFKNKRPVEKPGPKAFHENKKNASK
jgi:hypothetical protein